jgi:hypothetical protein
MLKFFRNLTTFFRNVGFVNYFLSTFLKNVPIFFRNIGTLFSLLSTKEVERGGPTAAGGRGSARLAAVGQRTR